MQNTTGLNNAGGRAATFGRRGGAVLEVPRASVPGASVPIRAETDHSTSDAARDPVKTAARISIAFFFLLWLETLFAGTALITPINKTLLYIMCGVGFVAGLPLSIVVGLSKKNDIGWFKRGLIILAGPFLIAFAFGGLAWRASDWWEFGLSSQPFAEAAYPVTHMSHGRKGRRSSFEIDPFKVGGTEIPVPWAQYQDTWLHSTDYCITVLQRRSASGAIEIKTNGEYTWNEPEPVKLSVCSP
jgi:hypothetical protein